MNLRSHRLLLPLAIAALPLWAHAAPLQNSAAGETRPPILVPNGTTTTQYDPQQGFPDKAGGLSGMMVVIPQKEMANFAEPGADRQLDQVSRAEAGASLAIKLVFTGVRPDANGVANLTYDLKVTGPDGKLYGNSDYHSLTALIGQVGEGGAVYDNRDKVILLQFDPGDAPGVYKIEAVLHDTVAKLDLPLRTQVEYVLPVAAASMATPVPAAAPAEASVAASAASTDAAPAQPKTRKHKRHRK